MKTTRASLLILFYSIFFILNSNTEASEYISTCNSIITNDEGYVQNLSTPPIAANDTFVLVAGCGNNTIQGNVMQNDLDPDGDAIAISFVYGLSTGSLTISSNGAFKFTNYEGFLGTATFTYRICESNNSESCNEAKVVIFVKNDYDCDEIPDEDDIDNDNDGILDIDEGFTSDMDFDGFPNYLDIDSDNDGIVDNIEGQPEGNYIEPLWTDTNGNGWDDAYDPDSAGNYFEMTDTDSDGFPDFIDLDSDDDGVDDLIEGYDANFDGIADEVPSELDSDNDGLDDAFDTVDGWSIPNNPTGSDAPLSDHNNNGVHDWRDAEYTPIPGEDIYLEVTEVSESSIIVYPNPTNGIFNLKIPEMIIKQGIKLEMYSQDGKLHFEKIIANSKSIIDPGNIGSGIYFVKLKSNTKDYSFQLIINRN